MLKDYLKNYNMVFSLLLNLKTDNRIINRYYNHSRQLYRPFQSKIRGMYNGL